MKLVPSDDVETEPADVRRSPAPKPAARKRMSGLERREQLIRVGRRLFAEHGFACTTHACGDRGVREALDAYRDAGAWPGIRHRIEHIETLQDFDLPRFAAEGVVASMQTQHMMWLDPGRRCNWTTRMGDARCDRAFPTRSLWESGAIVSLGSDWPVARFDPRIGMASAQLRHAPGNGREPFDDQALTGDRKSTRLNSSHIPLSRMPSSA